MFLKRVTCIMRDTTHKRLKILAAQREETLIQMINDAVEMYLHHLEAQFSDPSEVQ